MNHACHIRLAHTVQELPNDSCRVKPRGAPGVPSAAAIEAVSRSWRLVETRVPALATALYKRLCHGL